MIKKTLITFEFENTLESVDKLFQEIEGEVITTLRQALSFPDRVAIAHYLRPLRSQMVCVVVPIITSKIVKVVNDTIVKREDERNVAALNMIIMSTCIIIDVQFNIVHKEEGKDVVIYNYGSARVEEGLPVNLGPNFSDTSR